MILHLGILDVQYGGETKKASVAVETTGDVAEILEDRYHIYQHFYEMHGQEIADALTESMRDSLEDLMAGAPSSREPLLAGTDAMRTMFNEFIDKREMDSLGYPGIPTQASLKGVNHRLKRPYAKDNPPRPSFRDTGLYEASFRAWVDE